VALFCYQAKSGLAPSPLLSELLFLIDGMRQAVTHATEIDNEEIQLLRNSSASPWTPLGRSSSLQADSTVIKQGASRDGPSCTCSVSVNTAQPAC
jgi:hypothetical protein